ncbi:phospholipase D-like domain-containing protein [Bradyrhizobium sp. Ai1a-2]|uniref:phospholipase D-like domain-containing protein n=1 Tax=Bradyrhizobium sp. Ai1a-2 TaxID=196490 RepID=UPI001FCA8F2A|nr:phospholipase D-like domain-containing protein [Bradyrhizobium sp. Ai1a-2]
MPSLVLRQSMLKHRGPFLAEPESVRPVGTHVEPVRTEPFLPEMVPRNCRLEEYEKVKVPAVDVDQEIITYCSPDSTYAVTKKLFDDAKKSILIGIYDFSAEYIKELVLDALKRGVKVKLMLDIDSKDEQELFDSLSDSGVDGVPAPSCASHRVHYFSSSHEKVIVIDGEWCIVQSGNYSENSIPLNVKDGGDPAHFRHGNRDTGLAIRSRKLSKFFTGILESDMNLELTGPEALPEAIEAANAFMIEKAPTKLPTKLFPSKTFKLTKSLSVQPVLSPDNYMQVIPDKLRVAKKSVLIEQQYIRGKQPDIQELLTAIKEARGRNGRLDIRIVLGKVFSKKDLDAEKKNLALLKQEFGLVAGKNIRYIDTTRFVHCHNKMILVDGQNVLVSSQNWSDSAVSKNREAGVWLSHSGICDYFTQIFESDWKTALKSPTAPDKDVVEAESLRAGGFVRVAPADYQEV